MTASSRTRKRVACCTLIATALAIGIACEDFPRTNPFDEDAKITLVVSGSDVATAIGDTVTFHVRAAQGDTLDQLAYWVVPSFLRSTNVRNQFVAIGVSGKSRDSGTVSVAVNSNAASKPFLFAQQPRSVAVSACGSGDTVITFNAFLTSANPTLGEADVCSTLLDRRGKPVPDTSHFTGVIRDPAIVRFVSPDQAELNALAPGSTYVVYTRAGFTDSLRVDVRQVLALYRPNPPACLNSPGVVLAPGQTVQLQAVPSDANGNALVDTAAARAALVGMRWTRGPGLNVTLSSSGFVTAVGASAGWVLAEDRYNQIMFYCYVTVQ